MNSYLNNHYMPPAQNPMNAGINVGMPNTSSSYYPSSSPVTSDLSSASGINPKWGAYGSLAAAGLNFLGGQNQTSATDAASPYIDKANNIANTNYEPYINAGRNALTSTQDSYNREMSNPGQELNRIGQDYQQSPGFKYALQQALQGVDHSAEAGGMGGSLQQDQWRTQMAHDIGNQDFHQWLGDALNLHGQGQQGLSHISDQGYDANNQKTTGLMNNMLTGANLAYEGQNTQNQADSSGLGAFTSALGTALPFIMGL